MIIPAAYQDLFWFLNPAANLDNPPYRYFCYEGGRGSGKSWAAAMAITIRAALTPTRVICTREYQNSMSDSVKHLLEQTIDRLQLPGYSSTRDSIINVNGSTFTFKGMSFNPESTIKGFEGAQICWVEEAQTVSNRSLEILIPTIRATGSTLIFTWNPLTRNDAVWQRFISHTPAALRAQTLHKHTTWRDTQSAGVLSQELYDMMTAARETPEYSHVWEGEPYDTTTNTIMTWDMLHSRTQLPANNQGATTLGIDVARYGNDRTAIAIVTGRHLENLVSWNHASITDSAERIRAIANRYHPTLINVDDTGVGGGLTDILTSQHLPVRGINYAQSAKRPDLYPNVASELWFDFADQLGEITISPHIDVLPELLTELSTRGWSLNSRNLRQVQAKKTWKETEQAGSPDLADAVLLAFYKPAVMPSWDVAI